MAGRAAADTLRIGNVIGAAFTNRRILEAVEARLFFVVALAVFSRLIAYPFAALWAWIGTTLLYRA